MRPLRQSRRKHRVHGHPVILFTIGATTFAIAASAVNEIQGIESLKPSGRGHFGKVRHTLQREGRRYWVVDANIHFGMLPTASSRVLLLADLPIAVKVDRIDRMGEMSRLLPLPRAFQGDESNWYVGLAVIDGKVMPVVSPTGFLSHYDLNMLEDGEGSPARTPEPAGAMA